MNDFIKLKGLRSILFGLMISTFEVTLIYVVKFLIAYLVSEILKNKEGQR